MLVLLRFCRSHHESTKALRTRTIRAANTCQQRILVHVGPCWLLFRDRGFLQQSESVSAVGHLRHVATQLTSAVSRQWSTGDPEHHESARALPKLDWRREKVEDHDGHRHGRDSASRSSCSVEVYRFGRHHVPPPTSPGYDPEARSGNDKHLTTEQLWMHGVAKCTVAGTTSGNNIAHVSTRCFVQVRLQWGRSRHLGGSLVEERWRRNVFPCLIVVAVVKSDQTWLALGCSCRHV